MSAQERRNRSSRIRYWLTGEDGLDPTLYGPAPSRIAVAKATLRSKWRVRREVLRLWLRQEGWPRHRQWCVSVQWGAGCDCDKPKSVPPTLTDAIKGRLPFRLPSVTDQPLHESGEQP